jgi:anti-anti-sigma factor
MSEPGRKERELTVENSDVLDRIDRNFTTTQNRAVLKSVLEGSPPELLYVTLSGALDGENCGLLLEAIKELVDYAADLGAGELVLDLKGLTYASSGGIGILMSILTLTRVSAIDLKLKSPTVKVMSVMKLLGFDTFFTIIEE